eukprot:g7232.t1
MATLENNGKMPETDIDSENLPPYGDWVEGRMRSLVYRYSSEPASLARNLLQPASNTRELLRRSREQASFRLPMEKEFKDHERCKAAASSGQLTAAKMLSSTPPGRTACWMPPKSVAPLQRWASSTTQDGATGSTTSATAAAPLELFSPDVMPTKIQNEEGLRHALQLRGDPCAGWEKLQDSLRQDVLLMAWLRNSRKLGRRTFPEELFREIGAFLDPIGGVLLCADYLRSVAAEARTKDIREGLLDTSMSTVAAAEYEEKQRKSGGARNRDGSGAERATGQQAQSSFMASEVLRRYYVGVHGLDFEIKAGAVVPLTGSMYVAFSLIHEFPEDRLDLFDRTQIERAQNPSALALCGISGLYVGVFSAVQKFPRSAKWLDRVENWWEQRAVIGMEKKAAMAVRAGTTSTGLGGGAASASMDASSVAMSAETLKVCKSAGLLGRSLARQLCAVGPSLLAVYVYGICTSRGLIETFCADRNTALGVECSNKYKELAREDWEVMGGGGGN